MLRNAYLWITLKVPEVVGTENWVNSSLPFLLDSRSIAKKQSWLQIHMLSSVDSGVLKLSQDAALVLELSSSISLIKLFYYFNERQKTISTMKVSR